MNPQEFIHELLSYERSEFQGLVKVTTGADGLTLFLRFQDGKVTDLMRGTPPSLLETALLGSPLIKDKDLKRLRKQAQQEQRDPGELVLEQQLLPDQEVIALILPTMEQQLSALLVHEHMETEQLDPNTPLGWRSIGDFFHLQVPIQTLLQRAAQHLGRWDLVREHLPSLKDVFYATPQSFSFLQQQDQFPSEVAVINQLDGQRDVGEVVDLSGLDPFEGLQVVENLHRDGHVDLINPVQLFQLGCDIEKQGDLQKARRLFERAEERGLDDFDIGYKLGEVYVRLDMKPDAIDRFLAFAEKCVGQFRIEDTIRSCKRIIEIDPDNLPISERYVSLLARYGKGDEAVAEGLALARRFEELGEEARAQSTLEKIVEHAEANEEVLRQYLDFCCRSGHLEGCSRARRHLANLYYQREDHEKALELYQQLFVSGEEEADIRSRLIELHLRMGNRQKVADHLEALRRISGWATHSASPEAREFFRKIVDLDPDDASVTGWLVEDARVRGERAELLEVLQEHCDRLERSQRWSDAREAAAVIVQLLPEDSDPVRKLTQLERQCGTPERAVTALEQFAQRISEDENRKEELGAVLEEILELNPLSAVGRDLWRQADTQSEPAKQERIALEGVLIELAGGELDTVLANISERSPENAVDRCLIYLCGQLARLRGRADAAGPAFEWCADAAAAHDDRGLLGQILEALGELTPDHPKLGAWQDAFTASAATVASSPGPSTRVHSEAKTEILSAAPPRHEVSGIGGSLARLRAMKNPEAPALPAQETEAEPVPVAAGVDANFSDPPEHKVNSKGVMSSLARLRNMKDGGSSSAPAQTATSAAPAAAADGEVSSEEPGDLPAPKKPKKQLGSAASRLNALKNKPT